MRSVFKKRLLTALLVLVILALIDFGARIIGPASTNADGIYSPNAYSDMYLPDTYGHMRPHLDTGMPNSSSENPIPIRTNQFGMRMREVELQKKPDVIRIAVMGDSTAFGWMEQEENTFPRVMETLLNQSGKKQYEVLNFAAPGYTSYHGLKQYERLVHNFNPDILILAFGLYDFNESRVSEREYYTLLDSFGLTKGLTGFPKLWHDYSAFGCWVISKKLQRGRDEINQLFQNRAARGEWRVKVDEESFKANLSAIIEHQRSKGGNVILAHLNLVHFQTLSALNELRDQFKLRLLNIRPLFDQLGGIEERKKCVALELEPSGLKNSQDSNSRQIRFRIFVPPETSVSTTMYITGAHEQLGGGVPNKVKLYDDGTHGDEQKNDRVWSLSLTFNGVEPVDFAFTNSGEPGQWPSNPSDRENTFKNTLHYVRIPLRTIPDGDCYNSLLYIYGRPPYAHLLAPHSNALPNAIGHTAIAKRLNRMIQEISK